MRSHKAGLVGFAYGVLWGMHSTGALWKRTPQAGWLVRAQQGKQRGGKTPLGTAPCDPQTP